MSGVVTPLFKKQRVSRKKIQFCSDFMNIKINIVHFETIIMSDLVVVVFPAK